MNKQLLAVAMMGMVLLSAGAYAEDNSANASQSQVESRPELTEAQKKLLSEATDKQKAAQELFKENPQFVLPATCLLVNGLEKKQAVDMVKFLTGYVEEKKLNLLLLKLGACETSNDILNSIASQLDTQFPKQKDNIDNALKVIIEARASGQPIPEDVKPAGGRDEGRGDRGDKGDRGDRGGKQESEGQRHSEKDKKDREHNGSPN